MDWIKGNTVTVPNIKQVIGLNNSCACAIYLNICDKADRKGQCFPSVQTLSKESGACKNTVLKAIQLLIKSGIIEKRKRYFRGRLTSNTYQIVLVKDEINNKEKFQKPSLREIKNEIRMKKYDLVNPDVFFNYYETINWRVGKNKMKNWCAALSGWQSRNKENQEQKVQSDKKYMKNELSQQDINRILNK